VEDFEMVQDAMEDVKHSEGGSLQLLLYVQKSKQRRGLSPFALSGDNSFTMAHLEMVQAIMDNVRHSQLGH